MAEVVQQQYILGEAWLFPGVNVVNTVHLSKHHSYSLLSRNRGHRDRIPEHHLIALRNHLCTTFKQNNYNNRDINKALRKINSNKSNDQPKKDYKGRAFIPYVGNVSSKISQLLRPVKDNLVFTRFLVNVVKFILDRLGAPFKIVSRNINVVSSWLISINQQWQSTAC